jgi:hypothetical protein
MWVTFRFSAAAKRGLTLSRVFCGGTSELEDVGPMAVGALDDAAGDAGAAEH